MTCAAPKRLAQGKKLDPSAFRNLFVARLSGERWNLLGLLHQNYRQASGLLLTNPSGEALLEFSSPNNKMYALMLRGYKTGHKNSQLSDNLRAPQSVQHGLFNQPESNSTVQLAVGVPEQQFDGSCSCTGQKNRGPQPKCTANAPVNPVPLWPWLHALAMTALALLLTAASKTSSELQLT